MFKVVAEPRKRRVWSPRTIAASVTFHLLLVAGFAAAATSTPPPPTEIITDLGELPPEPPKVVRADPPPPPPAAKPDEPVPVKGQTVVIQPPPTVPDKIPEPDLHATPLTADQVTGLGKPGTVFGPPDADPAPRDSTGPHGDGDENLPRWETPISAEMADARPELSNRRQAEMILQRNYPPLLRDVGATGRTTVQLIIDKDGKVEPGSVRVQESTYDAFNDAAIRAVERFRFRPATYHGHPVSVLVTLPIEWRLEN